MMDRIPAMMYGYLHSELVGGRIHFEITDLGRSTPAAQHPDFGQWES